MALAALAVAVIACGGKGAEQARPQPRGGLAPVTPGELVQLRLAVEGFDAIFDARAEEQDLLPALVHAWATFYHRPDPAPTLAARYAFTRRLCEARMKAAGMRRTLFTCMDRLREALYADLVWVTDAFIRAGHPDKIGEYRLSQLRKDFALRLQQFRATAKLRQDRRAVRQLPTAAACHLEQPLVPVVGIHPTGLTLNGFPILTAPEGLTDLKGAELDGFRHQLENRLSERPAIRRSKQQVVLAADHRVKSGALGRLLSTLGSLGVTRICLKVLRRGAFPVPCCLITRMTPRLVALQRSVRLEAKGAFRVEGTQRTPLPGNAAAWPAARKGLTEPGGQTVAVQLGAGVTMKQLVTWLGRLGAPGHPPEIVLQPATPSPAPPTRAAPPEGVRP